MYERTLSSTSQTKDFEKPLSVEEGEEGVVVRRQRRRAKKESRNINVRAAFIHVIGDLIQSIGVVIAGYVIWFGKHYAVRQTCTCR